MQQQRRFTILAALAVCLAGGLLAVGCSRDGNHPGSSPLAPSARSASSAAERARGVITQDGAPPSGVVEVANGADKIDFWPYTSASLEGTPVDPVNLLFAGKADPVRIRAALLSLDGDRTAFGFPDAYPFNQRWTEAIGDVQTTYAEGEGWQSSVIQLQLGTFDPARIHLRLFRTGVPFGDGGTWTIGGAHFDLLIPGTANHQTLAWELPQQIVLVDMIRSGLLDPSTPYQLTDVINGAPTFRDIPKQIYDGIPDELKVPLGLPPGPAAGPTVLIPSDGRATIFNVTGEAPLQPGTLTQSFTIQYNQIIPKPLCSEDPSEYVQISGPLQLNRTGTLDAAGHYQYQTLISGGLTITPLSPPGSPYTAQIGDQDSGTIDSQASWGLALTKRIAPQSGGSEFVMTRLKVASNAPDSYRAQSQCR